MAVKYVKDFSFPASGGFHGDVQRFAKGGHVTKVPAKAKASAKDVPARAKPNAPAKGAPKMKSEPAKGKRQGYNEGGRVPGYDMDRLPAKKPPGRTMDLAPARRFKGAYEGYADGGEVYTGPPIPLVDDQGNPILYRPDDERPPPLPIEGPPPLPMEPVDDDSKRNDFLRELLKRDEERMRGDAAEQMRRLEEIRRQEMLRTPPRYMRDVEAGLDRGMRPGQMARQQRIEDRVNAEREAMMRPRYRIPEMPPELPGISIDEGRESIMPVESPRVGGLLSQVPGATLNNPMIMKKQDYDPGLANLKGSPSTREPMLTPYMPTYSPTTREESDAYLKAAGIVPRAEARFAKGGKVQKVMREYKEGKLHSGSKKGPLVKNREQAVAIALSEARKAGAKIPKKGEGGIFNDESMAYQSKGPKTRYTPAKRRREARERDMDRRALDKARHAERFAPGLSLDMRAKGGMMKGKKFPDLTGDGKVTRADILKGRGVIKDRKMPTHNRKPMYGKG